MQLWSILKKEGKTQEQISTEFCRGPCSCVESTEQHVWFRGVSFRHSHKVRYKQRNNVFTKRARRCVHAPAHIRFLRRIHIAFNILVTRHNPISCSSTIASVQRTVTNTRNRRSFKLLPSVNLHLRRMPPPPRRIRSHVLPRFLFVANAKWSFYEERSHARRFVQIF